MAMSCKNIFLTMVIITLLSPRSFAFAPRAVAPKLMSRSINTPKKVHHRKNFRSTKENVSEPSTPAVPLYRSEGIFSVVKPLTWTSSDVVSFIRKMLERDARERGAKPVRVGSRRNKSRILKVGHGGTLDPLATGVLVVGVGKGTKELQGFLSGSKKYTAEGELGFETNTLDMDPTGNITKQASFEHVTKESMEETLPNFVGTIQQVPPLFSAIKRGGKRLYEQARDGGATEKDIKIEAREVTIHQLQLLGMETPKFSLDIECGGGTYVRSLIRDIAQQLDTVATMTSLERTKQGQFTVETSLVREDWSPDNVYAAIDRCNDERQQEEK